MPDVSPTSPLHSSPEVARALIALFGTVVPFQGEVRTFAAPMEPHSAKGMREGGQELVRLSGYRTLSHFPPGAEQGISRLNGHEDILALFSAERWFHSGELPFGAIQVKGYQFHPDEPRMLLFIHNGAAKILADRHNARAASFAGSQEQDPALQLIKSVFETSIADLSLESHLSWPGKTGGPALG